MSLDLLIALEGALIVVLLLGWVGRELWILRRLRREREQREEKPGD